MQIRSTLGTAARRFKKTTAYIGLCVLPITMCGTALAESTGQGISLSMSDMKGNSGAAATTMIMGAPYSDGLKGAAIIFNRNFNTGKWEFKARLADSAEPGQFGTDVSISLDGKLAVVGAPFMNRPNKIRAGQFFIYKLNGSTWQKVSSPNTEVQARAMEGFALDVSGDGSTIFVGAPGNNDYKGTVQVLTKQNNAWVVQATLSPPAGCDGCTFGGAIASSKTGNRLVVSAMGERSGSIYAAGSVYIFERTAGKWTQVARLTASDPTQAAQFGRAVAVNWNADVLAVGSGGGFHNSTDRLNGRAYIFERNNAGVWTQVSKFDGPSGGNGFGSAVAVSGARGTHVVVGEYQASTNSYYGRVHTYVKAPGSKFTGSMAVLTGTNCKQLGASLAISPAADFLLAGGPATETNKVETGAACFYDKPKDWKLRQTFSSSR